MPGYLRKSDDDAPFVHIDPNGSIRIELHYDDFGRVNLTTSRRSSFRWCVYVSSRLRASEPICIDDARVASADDFSALVERLRYHKVEGKPYREVLFGNALRPVVVDRGD